MRWDDLPADFVVALADEQPVTLTDTSARYPEAGRVLVQLRPRTGRA